MSPIALGKEGKYPLHLESSPEAQHNSRRGLFIMSVLTEFTRHLMHLIVIFQILDFVGSLLNNIEV